MQWLEHTNCYIAQREAIKKHNNKDVIELGVDDGITAAFIRPKRNGGNYRLGEVLYDKDHFTLDKAMAHWADIQLRLVPKNKCGAIYPWCLDIIEYPEGYLLAHRRNETRRTSLKAMLEIRQCLLDPIYDFEKDGQDFENIFQVNPDFLEKKTQPVTFAQSQKMSRYLDKPRPHAELLFIMHTYGLIDIFEIAHTFNHAGISIVPVEGHISNENGRKVFRSDVTGEIELEDYEAIREDIDERYYIIKRDGRDNRLLIAAMPQEGDLLYRVGAVYTPATTMTFMEHAKINTLRDVGNTINQTVEIIHNETERQQFESMISFIDTDGTDEEPNFDPSGNWRFV